MNGGSLGMRTGSYGSLDKQLQQNNTASNNNNSNNNNYNGVSPIPTVRKPSKMQKEKERLFHWICKFAGRKRVGMLLLCVISAVVFVWVLYVGKGLVFVLSLSLSPFAVGIGLLFLMIVNLVDQLQFGSWEIKPSCTMLVFLLGRKS
jgi:hypothetical protein